MNELLQRKKRLADFESQITAKRSESWWQTFFEKNKWIFGYGLNYVILRSEQAQPRVGGTGLDGSGEAIADFMMATTGDVRFTVLVEIKTPDTPLLAGTAPVRSGAWSLSRDLTDALTQVQGSAEMWSQVGSRNPKNVRQLESRNIYTIKPKGILVIGRLDEAKNSSEKLTTFELFRQSVHGAEIIAFDELLERARYIVKHRSQG